MRLDQENIRQLLEPHTPMHCQFRRDRAINAVVEKKLRMRNGLPFDEMAARRSFARSIGKFQPQATKPVAILTAFRAERSLADNHAANVALANDLQQLNLGFYPVNGMGQEDVPALFGLVQVVEPSSEESFVVQPRGEMPEEAFEALIRSLLLKYGQFGAMMKLPNTPQAFLLRSSDGERENKGSEIGARTPRDDYYSQLQGGPRADAGMLSPWEIWGERNPIKRVLNWWGGRSAMNRPADRSKTGRRFSIRPGEEEVT